jgi:hypothetical protein
VTHQATHGVRIPANVTADSGNVTGVPVNVTDAVQAA